MSEAEARGEVVLKLARDPLLAHEMLFSHRHPDEIPAFHEEIIRDWHGPSRSVLTMAFRGAAKSTLAEEAIIIEACLRRFRNFLIIGENYDRACDRLRSVKREFENNELITGLFGGMVGPIWHEAKIELSNGVVIQAAGQGQAVRGTKHIDLRPDFLFVDDLESQESVATPDARRKLSSWVFSDLFPALDPHAVRRVAATPLDPEAWAVSLLGSEDWVSNTYPIEYVDEEGARRASWPSRFPLEWIDRQKAEHVRAGKTLEWEQEYMCRSIDPETRLFRHGMFRFKPDIERTWEAVYVAYDPARTTKATSATTGYVVASWVGRRLVIWEAGGQRWQPSELIDHMFEMERKYEPVVIGVEKDGLSDWIEEPIRQEQLKRSMLLPVRALKAPKGKIDFIQRLQPLFVAGDIVFAGGEEQFSDTVAQFLSFPSGAIDIPNAFAYLLDPQMKSGLPVYEDAYEKHIASNLSLRPGPVMLAINAGSYGTTAVLFQYKSLVLTVHLSWANSGDAGQCLPSIMEEARLYAGRAVTVVAPPEHFDGLNSFGLRAACRGIAEVRRGGDPVKGREMIRQLLRSETQGCPRLLSGPEASWFRRALYGGYSKEDGRLEPRPSLYATMMAGLESAMASATLPAGTDHQATAATPDGRTYKTAEARWR